MLARRAGIVMAGLALALPVSAFQYGNWCGAYHPPSGANPDPINQVDAACRKHDLAYKDEGPSAEADAELVRDLAALLNSGDLDDKEFGAAVVIATAMSGKQYWELVVTDLGDGKVSSVVKVGIATGDISVALPTSVTAAMLGEVADEIGGPGGKIVEVTADVVRLPARVVGGIADVSEKVLDEGSRAWRKIKSWF